VNVKPESTLLISMLPVLNTEIDIEEVSLVDGGAWIK